MSNLSSHAFQSLGGGTYRVTGFRVNPRTGRYMTPVHEGARTPSNVLASKPRSDSK